MTAKRTLIEILRTAKHPISSLRKLIPVVRQEKKKELFLPHIQKIRHDGHALIIIRHPDKKDTAYLKRKYRLHHLHIDDILSPIQRPKVDFEQNYIFFVYHYPFFNEETLKIESKEMDFFLTEKDVVIIIEHDFPCILEIVDKLSKKRTIRSEYFGSSPQILLYHILDSLVDSIFPLLNQIGEGLEEIDREVFTGESRHIAERISFLRRNIIFFQSIVRPELESYQEIEKVNHKLLTYEFKTHFANILDHLQKIADQLANLNELSNNLSSTFESYLSFKTNETIKILTIFSVILLPLTLLTSIYGMNLSILPLAEHPLAFFLISFIMLAIVASMLIVFKWKRWI